MVVLKARDRSSVLVPAAGPRSALLSQSYSSPWNGSSRVNLTPGVCQLFECVPLPTADLKLPRSQKCPNLSGKSPSSSVLVAGGGRCATDSVGLYTRHFAFRAPSCSCAVRWLSLGICIENCFPQTSLKIAFSFKLHRSVEQKWSGARPRQLLHVSLI